MRSIHPAVHVAVFLSACASPPDVAELHRRYMAASNAHDVETMAEMTAENVVWQLGPYTLKGKVEALLPNAGDAVMNTTLEVRDRRVIDNVVECVVVERNDALRAIGMESWRHYPRFVFDSEGKVLRKEPWRSSPDDAEFRRRLQPFSQWVKENHPEAVPDFSDMSDTFGREPALRALRVREQWIAAGRPGLIKDE